jgi:hypothetical protein
MTAKRKPHTFDPYRILSRAERVAHVAAYQRFLHERDGEPEVETCQLAKREAFFRDIEAKPVRWSGDIDDVGFYQHMYDQAHPDIEPRTVMLVSAAKANRGESYGVALELKSFRTRSYRATENPLYLHLMFEERYHTQILAEICRTCGIEPVRNLRPGWLERSMIHAMMYLPEWPRWIAIFAGEIVGTEVFNVLRENVHLYSAEPKVEERLRLLFTEIWTDEVGHASYLRARIGPIGIRIARRLVPLFTRALLRAVPQGEKIGLTPASILARLRGGIEIPPAMGWIAQDPPAI